MSDTAPYLAPRLAFYSGNYNDFPSGFVCSIAGVPISLQGCSITSPFKKGERKTKAGTGGSARGGGGSEDAVYGSIARGGAVVVGGYGR